MIREWMEWIDTATVPAWGEGLGIILAMAVLLFLCTQSRKDPL